LCDAVNDATLTKAGDIFQYYIALRDCFKLKTDEILQIELNGDVSIISKLYKNSFQCEVKHHFGNKNLIDRDKDFWKTLSNWYIDYERLASFSTLSLYTTAAINSNSQFHNWNKKKPEEKLVILRQIGGINKSREVTFRKYFKKIFDDDVYDENKLLAILSRFEIEHSQNQISAISKEFTSYIGYIPENNRDDYIAALLGRIISVIKDPPHHWEVSREDFDKILQQETPAYCSPKERPLPDDFADVDIPEEKVDMLLQKKFVEAIRKIKYEKNIPKATSDYWKAEMTVIRYFKDDLLYTRSLPFYKNELKSQMNYEKESRIIETENLSGDMKIKHSKLMYNSIMKWDAKDFGTIVKNQGYFQRGIIHTIVDDDDFSWDVGEEDEH